MSVSDLQEHQDDEDNIKCIANPASILRKELTTNEQWTFTGSGSLMGFQCPPMLTSSLRWLLLGTRIKEVTGKRDEASKKRRWTWCSNTYCITLNQTDRHLTNPDQTSDSEHELTHHCRLAWDSRFTRRLEAEVFWMFCPSYRLDLVTIRLSI